MPRPKRSKIAPSAPTRIFHERVSQPASAVRGAPKTKESISSTSSARVTNGSDDSDGLVVAKRGGRNGRDGTPQEYTMSGALALEDIGASRLRPPSTKTRAELTRIAREADHAQVAKQGRAGGTKAQAVESGNIEQIPSSIPGEPDSASKNVSGGPNSVLRQRSQARLGSKVLGTPNMQSSFLGGAGFKKRPRQPSLLQMVQSQNHTQIEPYDDDDMYNFLPDDESTPLVKSLSQPYAHTKSSPTDRSSASRKRKQVTPEVQVPASQSQSTHPHSSPTSAPSLQEDLYGVSTEEDQPQASLPPHRSTKTPEPQIFSDTLAPPQSSSPVKPRRKVDPHKPVKAPGKRKPRAQEPRHNQTSPAPSPPASISTQISLVRPAKTRPLTTATLQNLLPRRRARGRPKGDYDLPSSSDLELDSTGLDEDEDELSFHATKVRRKKPGAHVPKIMAKKKASAPKRLSKTYSRKNITASDAEESAENASDGENASGHLTAGGKKTPALDKKAKREMERLADKFREVDEYTLDFEDMTGSSSQMKDAR